MKTDSENSSEKKQGSLLRWTRVQTLMLAGVLILLLLTVAVLGVELGSLHRSIAMVEKNLQQIQMDKINEAVDAMTDAASQLASIDVAELNRTAASLRLAADQLKTMNVDTLNEAIASLRDAADTLKQLDMDAFNEVIVSLNAASENLAKITGGVSSIFGR